MLKNSPKELSVLRSGANDLSDYLISEDIKLKRLQSLLRDRSFTVGEDIVPYRVMSHWAEKGILPAGVNNSGGWRRFTFIEVVWMWVVLSLRSFGLSLEAIAQARTGVMKWDKKTDSYPLFEYYVAKAFSTSLEVYVAVSDGGVSTVASSRDLDASRAFMGHNNLLLVSLRGIASKMGFQIAKPDFQIPLSKGEEEMLSQVRSDSVKEVRARIKNGGISDIESVETYPDVKSASGIHKNLEQEKAFAEFVMKYADGKKQSVEVRRRKRVS